MTVAITFNLTDFATSLLADLELVDRLARGQETDDVVQLLHATSVAGTIPHRLAAFTVYRDWSPKDYGDPDDYPDGENPALERLTAELRAIVADPTIVQVV